MGVRGFDENYLSRCVCPIRKAEEDHSAWTSHYRRAAANAIFTNNAYVIVGQFLTHMQKPWRRIRDPARLDAVRIHDLRHMFASQGVAMGQGLPIIGKLLGHSQLQTTARYAHLAAEPVIEVADLISERLARSLQTASSGSGKDVKEHEQNGQYPPRVA